MVPPWNECHTFVDNGTVQNKVTSEDYALIAVENTWMIF